MFDQLSSSRNINGTIHFGQYVCNRSTTKNYQRALLIVMATELLLRFKQKMNEVAQFSSYHISDGMTQPIIKKYFKIALENWIPLIIDYIKNKNLCKSKCFILRMILFSIISFHSKKISLLFTGRDKGPNECWYSNAKTKISEQQAKQSAAVYNRQPKMLINYDMSVDFFRLPNNICRNHFTWDKLSFTCESERMTSHFTDFPIRKASILTKDQLLNSKILLLFQQ